MKKDNVKLHFGKSFYIGLLTIASSIAVVATILSTTRPKRIKEDPTFVKYDSYYDGNQVQIKTEGEGAAIQTITMTAAADASSINGKTITIESAAELRLFSTMCSEDTAFLGYTYNLIANIEWDTQYTFNPIGTSSNGFTGTFDGQGYEIEGLSLTLNNSSYTGGLYYSMFNYVANGATVTNLGLSHPELKVLDAPQDFANGGVSYLVGENNGTISNSFVVDDEDASKELAGISVSYSNARVSDFVVTNKGTLRNCYVVTSRVFNIKQNDLVDQYNQIAISNTGTIENCYFYDDSIKTLTPNDNKATITYKASAKMVDKVNDYFGTYVSSVDYLISSIDSAWYTKNDYGTYKDYTGIKYGLMRGITLSGSTFTINTEKDFAYMYELFNADDKFASNELTYTITADLNLAKLPIASYTYKKGIGSTIKGATISGTPTMANNSQSSYPTIYNADIMNSSRIAKSTGVDCYGLFNYLTGTVENLNVVPLAMNFASIEASTNAKGIGVLSGYIEGGHVKNVNVYANITNAQAENIGEYYIGGISGILGGNGKINGATSAGSINLVSAQTTLQASSSYMGGVAIGGIVGYIESSSGAVYTCLNAMDITAKLGASVTYAIGGVIGAGYTMNYDKTVVNGITTAIMRTEQLENVGTITVGDSTNHTYQALYVAGIIARHLGELDEVCKFTNNGTISVYANGNTTYVSGVENADIISTAVTNTKIEASSFKDSAGNTLFYASSLSNGGNVTVTGDSTNLQYTNVLNINAGNQVKSNVSDLYNLAYGYKFVSGSKTRQTLNTQSIDISVIDKFAPVLNVIGGTSQYSTKTTTLYNLRSINYTMSASIGSAKSLKYAGVALGTNISFDDVRNEGQLAFSIDKTVTASSTLKVSGVFEEISEGSYANLVFNGGNITFSDINKNEKQLDIYASGICYSSNGVITDTKQNPLNADYDSSLIGSLNSAINNGKISFESEYINSSTKFNTIQTTNYQGKLYFSGIAYENSGIISNTFNLGNIFIGTIGYENKEYFAAGISNINKGQYAQIRDTANNGEIRNIAITNLHTKVRSSGISITTNSEKQVMAFVINYGTIYAFLNEREDDRTSSGSGAKYSQASGILTLGLCNIVNVVNYGNVYANSNAGGMIAKLDLSLYGNNPSDIKIANALNYGNVMSIKNYYTQAATPYYATYQDVKALSEVSLNEVQAQDYYGFIDRGVLANNQFDGALIGIANYNNKNKIAIRYLINFALGGIPIVASEYNTNSVSTDVATLYNVEPDGSMNQILNGQATYAPLSTEIVGGNIGVFNKNFTFRKAIEGDSSVIDSSQVTDKYLSNFLQFIPFEKVSDNIINKIGWKSLAYQAAAEEFMKNLDKVVTLINKTSASTSNYSTLVADSTATDAWLSSCNQNILRDLFDEAIETGELSTIKDVINYVLFTADSRTGITIQFRRNLIAEVIDYLEADAGNAGVDYYDLLNALLYDELLANIISGSNVDYSSVKTTIQTIINGKTRTELEPIVDNYIQILTDTPEVLDPLFLTYQAKYLATKISVLETLLEGFSNDEIEKLYNLIISSGVDSSSVKYYSYLLSHTDTAKTIFSNIVAISANESSQTYLDAMNNALKQYGLSEMLEEVSIDSSSAGYDSSLETNFNTNLNSYITSANYAVDATTADYTTGNRNVTSLNVTPDKDYVALWNLIKNNSRVRTYLESILPEVYSVDSAHSKGIYAPATEYNNTYQSLDGPSNSSDGLTMVNPGIVRIIGTNNDDSSNLEDTTNIKNRFIYTPDEVVSYGTHFYGPFQTTSNQTYSTGTGRRYLDLEDTGTTNATKKKYVPIFISSDYETIYNKISTTANPKVYEMVWNDWNKKSSKYQWVSKIILDRNAVDSTSILYKNLASGDTYIYNGNQVTTEYIANGYDFNPELIRSVKYDREAEQTLPAGTYQYKNLNNGRTYSVTIPANTTVNFVTNGKTKNSGSNHDYRNFYFTGYVSASLITGVYYHHSIWVDKNKIQGVYLTAKEDENDPIDNFRGVQTTGYINYFIDDLINLDGVRTKGKSDGRISWDESNIINSLMKYVLNNGAGRDVVLHALADVSINGINNDSILMMLLKTIDVNNANITFRQNSVLSMVLSSDTSEINTTLNGRSYLNEYLQDLISGETYNHKDIVIQTGAVDRDSFIRILQEAYEYSKYSELYRDYSNIVKSTLNDYIYEYIDDVLYNETDSNITSMLSSVSDNDLTAINAIFSSNGDEIEVDNVTYGGFEIHESVLYTSDHTGINSQTYDNKTYDRVLVGKSASEVIAGSGIRFSTGDYQYGYTIEIIYGGSGITLTNGVNSYNISTLNDIDKYEKTDLGNGQTWFILTDENSKIYSIKLYTNAYNGYSSERTYYSDAIIPFTTASTSTSNYDSGGVGYYYNISVAASTSSSTSYSFVVNKATNVSMTSLNVSFYVQTSDDSSYLNTTITTTGLESNINQTLAYDNYQQYSGSINVSTLTTSNKNFGINIAYTNTGGNWLNGPSATNIYVYNIVLTYVFSVEGGTTITFVQDVLNPSSSTMTVSNSNSNVGLYFDAAHDYEFPTNNNASFTGINSQLTIKPWYKQQIIYTKTVVNELILSDISMLSISEILTSFSNYYDGMSAYAKYLLRNVIYSADVNGSSVDLDEDSIVFVKAYGDAGSTLTIGSETPEELATTDDYYAFDLSQGSYSITTTGTGVVISEIYVLNKDNIVSVSSNGNNNIITSFNGTNYAELFNADYSEIATFASNINTIVPTTLEDMTRYQTFVTVYPYAYCNRTNPVTYRLADLRTIVSNLFPSITDNSGRYVFDYDNYDVFTVQQVKDLINSIAAVDYDEVGSSLDKLITRANSHYDEILGYIVGSGEISITSQQEASLIDAIAKIRALAVQNSYNDIKKYLNAAYVGDNFISKSDLSQMTTSIVYTLLSNYSSGTYNFITSNSTVSGEVFKNLLVHLGYSAANNDTYGIYALSSSEGIGNGIFIPDNLTLSTMDKKYGTIDNVLMLKDTDDAEWRGGSDTSQGVAGTVDYAFYHDMKQLVKSISTDVFELNVTANSLVLNSVDDQIDNTNKVITYYLTSGLGSVYNASSISINNGYKLANGATLSSQSISLTGSNVIKTQGVSVIVNDAFTVKAEDTGVSSKYTLKFIAMDPSGLQLASDVNSLNYSGGTVTLTLTGNDMPDGLDIEPYLVITVDGDTYSTAGGYWKLDPAYTNNGVVNNGSASIRIIIDKSLPGGTDAVNITVDLSNRPSVAITKTQNTEKNITSFGFVPFGAANQEYSGSVPTSITSTIPFGRAYDYSDLTDPESSNFYLYDFSISPNATVAITASKTVLDSGLMRYVVQYKVTAEAGGTAKTYTHTLNESQYFTENSNYVSIYADGDQVTSISAASYADLSANEKPKYLYEGTLTYNIASDIATNAKFNSSERYYKIRYSEEAVTAQTFTTNGSLYTLSNGLYYQVTSGSFSENTTYYKRNYQVTTVTIKTFKTDGSLYKLINGNYVQVFNGSFDSNETYYGLVYDQVSVNSNSFTTNGSLYTRTGDGSAASPYVYKQVIDRRDLEDSMFASVAFNRTDASGNSIEPQYRVKYSLANFYTLGDNVEFGTTDSTLGNLATTNITYAGLTVTVSENNDTGSYRFIYTYKNTGVWNNGEAYVRYYEFPEFIVEKQASTDALLHKLTFLEESIVLGNTATVILPTTPLVPDKSGAYYDNTEYIYSEVFNSTTRQIVVSATGIKYNSGTDATNITDYYAIGTVSDADLSYYSPGFEINEYAQIYQYTTYTKLTEYGVGKQTDSDANILSEHDDMYLYVPYMISNEVVIYLVELDDDGYWTNVYTTDYAGTRFISVTSGSYNENVTYYTRSGNDYVTTSVTAQSFTTNGSLYVDSLVNTYDANTVNAKNAKTMGGFGNYSVAEFAGAPDKNSSLYMDYTGTPLEGHFWYVSYVVFSEDYLSGGDSNGNIRYYHISIIDATNNVQFEVVFYADTTLDVSDIYFTISETTYKKVNEQKQASGQRQISAYAVETEDTYSGSRNDISGFTVYKLKYKLQTLPSGYFYFHVDLPDGYVAEARTDKANNLSGNDVTTYSGAFDPQTSIITVKIQLEIVIKKGTNEDSNVWAFNTADIYTREAKYVGIIA